MIIKHCHIDKFRMLEDIDFDLGTKLTAIVGHNGTLKTTMLGVLSQTFSISKGSPLYGNKTIDGYNFKSQFSDKFKISDKDIPGAHKWKLDLYPGIYKDDCFEAVSVQRTDTKVPIRFISTEGKGKGYGYPQVPVYYLSLKRTIPLGEEGKINSITDLTEDETKFFVDEYIKIFGKNDDSQLKVNRIKSVNKNTISAYTDATSPDAISAGQDNLGKLILAVLSFKRLMDNCGDNYKGGVLLIDEIESTLHPEAQVKLIKRLRKYSKEYKIQFIYTTHSPSVVATTIAERMPKNENKIIYLKRLGNTIKAYDKCNIQSVIAELNGEIISNDSGIVKVDLYTEDTLGKKFMEAVLHKYKKYINFKDATLGAEEYCEIIRSKILNPKVIIAFDGDKNNNEFIKRTKDVHFNYAMFLPSAHCPEKMFYEYLSSLPSEDCLWSNEPGRYDKHKCFSGYENLIEDAANTESFKLWFKNNIKNQKGLTYKKICDHWCKNNEETVMTTTNKFIDYYNKITNSKLEMLSKTS